MIASTTTAIDGRPVSEYVGVVTGEAVLGANVFRDQEEQQAPDGEPERADRQPGEDSAAYLVTA